MVSVRWSLVRAHLPPRRLVTRNSLETTSDHQIWPVFKLHHVAFQESLCPTLVVSRLRWAPSLDVAQ